MQHSQLHTVNHFIFVCSLFRDFVTVDNSWKFEFLFDLYIHRHFARMLNLRAIEFASISKIKVIANYSELTVVTYEPRHEKTCFSHMRTTKVQIMHIRAV